MAEAFKFSGEGAKNYDQYLGPILFEPYAIDVVSKIEQPGIRSVLEIACGTGRVTRHLRNRFKAPVKLVASDINADMLHVAKTLLNDNSIEFKIEDAQNLSFPDNSFDLGVCQFSLMFWPDNKKGLSEAIRVLKPGGKFIFSTWDKTTSMPVLKLIFDDNILPYFKGEDTSRFLVPFSLFDPDLLKNWLEGAGFKNVKADRVPLSSKVSTARDIVTAFFIKHSLGGEVAAKSPADFDKMATKMEDDITRQFGGNDINFELSAFVITGEK
ncbi:MAG TPA: methyltransferase domain-containing protein [Mucilaginibacter sp.]|jgi:ubiquinone/menaquinone biosynthesis C-methylase UbiE